MPEKQQKILIGWAIAWLVLAGAVLVMSLKMMSVFGVSTTVLAWFGGVVTTLLIQQWLRVRDGVARKGPGA